ncbi:MAG: hypothetical protein HUJ68_01990 [Clostridia bacterium]|nr:hypothetical protein [Clostridia bacterium]
MNNYVTMKTKLQLGKTSDIRYVQEKDIDDIEKLEIDNKLPKVERIIKFLNNVKNPYIFRIDGRKVKFEYSNNDLNISQCIESILLNKENL